MQYLKSIVGLFFSTAAFVLLPLAAGELAANRVEIAGPQQSEEVSERRHHKYYRHHDYHGHRRYHNRGWYYHHGRWHYGYPSGVYYYYDGDRYYYDEYPRHGFYIRFRL